MDRKPAIGDRVYMTYGAMCGEDSGTVVEKQDSDWGPSWRVQVDEKPEHVCWIHAYVGTAEDRGGYYRTLNHGGIGTYLVTQ